MSKRLKYYAITHGQIVAAWHLLYLTNKYEGISSKAAIEIALRSGKLGGTLPAKEGLKICLDYRLMKILDGGLLQLMEVAEERIIPHCMDEDPNTNALRALLYHIISYHNFEWLIFYDSDPEVFKEYLSAHDSEWTSLLENAKLFNFEDKDVTKWWELVLTKYEDYKEKLKKAIGDVGEKLTYHHELNRVELDGYTPSKVFVKWASRISDRFGFDIQSIRGMSFQSSYSQKDKIQIEVKSSDTANTQRFRFFLSKPEWNKALESIDSYFFFCWTGINLQEETALQGPFIIPATYLQGLVPTDISSICEWSECRVVMDITKFHL